MVSPNDFMEPSSPLVPPGHPPPSSWVSSPLTGDLGLDATLTKHPWFPPAAELLARETCRQHPSLDFAQVLACSRRVLLAQLAGTRPPTTTTMPDVTGMYTILVPRVVGQMTRVHQDLPPHGPGRHSCGRHHGISGTLSASSSVSGSGGPLTPQTAQRILGGHPWAPAALICAKAAAQAPGPRIPPHALLCAALDTVKDHLPEVQAYTVANIPDLTTLAPLVRDQVRQRAFQRTNTPPTPSTSTLTSASGASVPSTVPVLTDLSAQLKTLQQHPWYAASRHLAELTHQENPLDITVDEATFPAMHTLKKFLPPGTKPSPDNVPDIPSRKDKLLRMIVQRVRKRRRQQLRKPSTNLHPIVSLGPVFPSPESHGRPPSGGVDPTGPGPVDGSATELGPLTLPASASSAGPPLHNFAYVTSYFTTRVAQWLQAEKHMQRAQFREMMEPLCESLLRDSYKTYLGISPSPTKRVYPVPTPSIIELLRERVFIQLKPEVDHKFTLMLCGICYCEYHTEEVFFMESCPHAFCSACVRRYVESKINPAEVTRILCPTPDCGGVVSYTEVKALLQPDYPDRFERYDRFLRNVGLQTQEGMQYCPKGCGYGVIVPKLPAVSTGGTGDPFGGSSRGGSRHAGDVPDHASQQYRHYCQTPSCKASWCTRCKVPWHDELTCTEFQRALKMGLTADETLPFIKWVKNHKAKRCPNPQCGYFVVKSVGCNMMTCSQCKQGFCYLCGQAYGRGGRDCGCALYG